jgi:hypothetical protein
MAGPDIEEGWRQLDARIRVVTQRSILFFLYSVLFANIPFAQSNAWPRSSAPWICSIGPLGGPYFKPTVSPSK